MKWDVHPFEIPMYTPNTYWAYNTVLPCFDHVCIRYGGSHRKAIISKITLNKICVPYHACTDDDVGKWGVLSNYGFGMGRGKMLSSNMHHYQFSIQTCILTLPLDALKQFDPHCLLGVLNRHICYYIITTTIILFKMR